MVVGGGGGYVEVIICTKRLEDFRTVDVEAEDDSKKVIVDE